MMKLQRTILTGDGVRRLAVTAMVAGGVCMTGASAFAQATAEFHDPDGAVVGSATLLPMGDGILIQATFDGLPEGTYALHLHETGLCDAPDFQTAGGHFNPDGSGHGFLNPDGPHAGDLPNIFVPAGGVLRVDLTNERVTLTDGPASLFDDDGTAFVLHGGADDYRSDPAGAAGPRVACAVLTR